MNDMSKDVYKYASIVLAVVVVGLIVYIVTRPKPVNTVALQQDLSQFSTELQAWNTQYQQNPTPQGQQQLSSDLTAFQQKLQSDE
jgi:hypothetical protein